MKQFEPIEFGKATTSSPEKRPKYILAAQQIRERIQSGSLRTGDQLPSERDLALSFGVAYLTVRHALHSLEQEGFVERHHGKGTFVTNRHSRSTKQRRELSVPPIYLLGLGPQVDARHDPVNWEIHLFRYQGIVEGGFRFGFPIEALKEWNGHLSETLIQRIAAGSGVILNGDQLSDSDILALIDREIRVVAVNRHRGLVCSEVQVDTKQGTMLAIEHLLQLGHRCIGIIVGDQRKPLMQLRLAGYREALSHYQVPFREDLVFVDSRGLPEDGAAGVEMLLRNPMPPTAVFTASDQRAFGAMTRAGKLGLSIPENLSIVGFDDLQEASELDPPLTTVRNPLHQSGFEAVRLIHDHQRDPDLGIQLVRLPMTLSIRKSAARLATVPGAC